LAPAKPICYVSEDALSELYPANRLVLISGFISVVKPEQFWSKEILVTDGIEKKS